MRPRLLDLFCGAGGAAMGYYRAGFEVVGVDVKPQPRYPFEFVQQEALWIMDVLLGKGSLCPSETSRYWLKDFAAIHASPPCQSYTTLKALHKDRSYPDLVARVRETLQVSGLPWIIENVVGAPLVRPTLLCGSYFNLGVRRHRHFETSYRPRTVPWCRHSQQPHPIDVSGTGSFQHSPRRKPTGGLGRKPRDLAEARAAMGIDWMERKELAQAIPPAYTEYLGRQLLAALAEAPTAPGGRQEART